MKKYKWRGVLAVEGSHRRRPDVRSRRAAVDTPVPLRFAREDTGGHQGAVVVGTIDTIERDGQTIVASGTFDDINENPDAREAARQMLRQVSNGVLLDLDDITVEFRVAKELLEYNDDGELKEDDQGRVTLFEINPDDEMMVFTDGRARAATLLAIPAFAEAKLQVDAADVDALMDALEMDVDDLALVTEDEMASLSSDDYCAPCSLYAAAPPALPAAHFTPRSFDGPTPLTVDDSGAVYGHIAAWDTCHTSFPGVCVAPPRSEQQYAYFHVGVVRTDENKDVPVGHITVGGGHADAGAGAQAAVEHYDDVSTVAADVHAYEDQFGIAVVGHLRDGLPAEVLHALRAGAPSGDRRRLGSSLELVAAHIVNVPGFPVPRPALAASGGRQMSLVAAGTIEQKPMAATFETSEFARKVAEEFERIQFEKQLKAEAKKLSLEIAVERDHAAEALRRQVHA